MKKNDIQKIFEVLSTALRCPVCDYKYNLERTKIIETKQDTEELGGNLSLLIHSNCEKCKSNVVFSVSISGPEIFSVGMITDLTDADTTKFSRKSAINAEQIMNFHHFLEDFNGDFAKILAK